MAAIVEEGGTDLKEQLSVQLLSSVRPQDPDSSGKRKLRLDQWRRIYWFIAGMAAYGMKCKYYNQRLSTQN